MDGEVRALRDEETLLRIFAGRNPEPFVHALRSGRTKKWSGSRFNLVCLFFPLVWFFYRRMFFYGAILMVAPLIIAVLFPNAVGTIGTGLSSGVAIMSTWLYVTHAQSRIASIERSGQPESVRDELIRKAGGTSVAGAVFGAAVTAAWVAVALAGIPKPLPACASDAVRDTIRNGVIEQRQQHGFDASVTVADLTETGHDGRQSRSCEFTISTPQGTDRLQGEMSWVNPATDQFKVQFKGPVR